MDYLEGLFGVDMFNKKEVTFSAGEYLKYTRDVYRRSLVGNPRYEHPPSIPEREWKVIIDDAKEKIRRKNNWYPKVNYNILISIPTLFFFRSK